MIRVVIERIIAEGQEEYYHHAARKILQAVVSFPGYLSGESFGDLERPNHRVIITSWSSLEAWQRWSWSDQRKALMAEIQPILMEQEKTTLLEPLIK